MNRILIVSDDVFMRDMVRLSLIDMRTEVRCAADADEMEGLCRRVLFDLVIVLHVAPFLCGRDVVRGVRPADRGGRCFTWFRGFSPNRPS